MKRTFVAIVCVLIFLNDGLGGENIIPLWPEGVPGLQETNENETRTQGDILWVKNVQVPTLEVFLPTKKSASGRAMVICPGGGYGGLAYDWEGTDVAKWLNSKGIAAFVLKYRLPNSKSLIEGRNVPLQDAQQAIRLVRKNAEKWNVNEHQIGIMGFSAGGHLASTLGTHFDDNLSGDAFESVSARPDFMVLIYPVITMQDKYTHQGSKNNLLGEQANQEIVDYYSNELHVSQETPPTFIVHSSDDDAVPVSNSILFYQALVREEIYAEMHIYPEGGHGYALAIGKGYLQTWVDRLSDWIDGLK